jgi:hypothetical protein
LEAAPTSELMAAEILRLKARVSSLEYVVVALLEEAGVKEEKIAEFVLASSSPFSTTEQISGGGHNLLAWMRHVRRAAKGAGS